MKPIKTEYKALATITAGTIAVFSIAACSIVSSNTSDATLPLESETAASITEITDAFSDSDLNAEYNADEAQLINLNGSTISSDSSSVKISGTVVTIKSAGTYVITGTLDDGYIVVDAGDSDDVRLVLKNADITSKDYAAIYCLNADNVYITLEDGTNNSLTNSGEFDSKDSNSVDGAIFAKTDITINGSGSLDVSSTDHGIVGKDDVTITGGNISISSTGDGIQANDSVSVKDAVISIICGKDGIQADNDNDLTKGYVYISSGEITIDAGDDGITASSSLQIDDGTISITRSYEGLEGQNVTINGGSITIVSSDDGINAVSQVSSGDMFQSDGSSLIITGGEIYVDTEGDGVDSNGTFEMTGGILTVMGPTSGANGSLDVNGSAVISGGTVVMAGASGMATNFTDAGQGTALLTVGNQSAGSEITVTDSSGKVILSATSDCSYQSVLVSSPEMEKDGTYTVTAGTYSEIITLSGYIYGSGSGFGFGGGMPGGNPGQMPGGGQGDFSGDGSGDFPGGGPGGMKPPV